MLDRQAYLQNGYHILPGFLSSEEINCLRHEARALLRSDDAVLHKGDKNGKQTLLKMWTHAGDDVFGLCARDQRLVNCAQTLLDDEQIYCYSHKMTMKEPKEGGAWEWHQDYGYWYEYGCLTPNMLSIWIAVDDATQENGCLQILEGSHTCGRIRHLREDGQYNCDPERVTAAKQRFKHRYVELKAGDAVAFDCNLLHTSAANNSEKPRWGFICSYNTLINEPYKQERDYGHDTALRPVAAGTLLQAASVNTPK